MKHRTGDRSAETDSNNTQTLNSHADERHQSARTRFDALMRALLR